MTEDIATTTTGSNDRLSRLGTLKERRQQIVDNERQDLQVPRWADPEIFVQYKPVDHSVFRRGQSSIERAQKRERDKVELNANIDVLINGCTAVYARLDGQQYSLKPGDPKGEFTLFDGDLAENLGLHEGATAREVVRALFITDGDIISHAQKVAEFSGYREAEADDELLGE